MTVTRGHGSAGKDWGEARFFGIALGYKIVVSALLIGFVLAFADDCKEYSDLMRQYGLEPADLLNLPFSNWDGEHYLYLAENGYRPSEAKNAFYPLLPLLIRAVSWITGNVFGAAMLTVTLLFFVFVFYLHRYIGGLVSDKAALLVVVAVFCFPTAFYLCVIYTEALFLALLFGFLYHYHWRPTGWSVPFAILLPLTRGQGFFVFGAILVNVVWRLARRRPVHFGHELANAAGFVIGMAGYFAFFWLALGDPLAGINAQKHFVFEVSVAHLLDPRHLWYYLATPPKYIFYPFHAFMDKLFILLMAAGLIPVALARNSLHFFIYFVLVYCPAAMAYGGSFMRFALLAFPFLVLACVPLWQKGPLARVAVVAVLSLSGLFQVYLISRFSLAYWVA
jgi:hypothetical protein